MTLSWKSSQMHIYTAEVIDVVCHFIIIEVIIRRIIIMLFIVL